MYPRDDVRDYLARRWIDSDWLYSNQSRTKIRKVHSSGWLSLGRVLHVPEVSTKTKKRNQYASGVRLVRAVLEPRVAALLAATARHARRRRTGTPPC